MNSTKAMSETMKLRPSIIRGDDIKEVAGLCDLIISTNSAGIAEYHIGSIGKADILLGKVSDYFPYGEDKWIESFNYKGRLFTIYLAYILV
jgi:hypothetical protein